MVTFMSILFTYLPEIIKGGFTYEAIKKLSVNTIANYGFFSPLPHAQRLLLKLQLLVKIIELARKVWHMTCMNIPFP